MTPTWTKPHALRSPTATAPTRGRDMFSTSHPNNPLRTKVVQHEHSSRETGLYT
jgi:hypothetical protein